MSGSLRLLTAPLGLSGHPRLGELVTLICTDDIARRARAEGVPATWDCATMAGDLAGQHEVDRELAREGRDRVNVERDLFIERVRWSEAVARARVAGVMAALGVDVDLEEGALDQPAVARAARTAFVRLYEEGLLSLAEQVVDTCPRCLTVVDRADAESAEVEGEELLLRLDSSSVGLAGADVAVEVTTRTPELVPAAVALAVPSSHPAVGLRLELPLAGKAVPVIAADVEAPFLVVAAHDRLSWEVARRHGLAPVELLDLEGILHHDGPLDGLGRSAARAAARDLLVSERVVIGAEQVIDHVARCRRCGTVLIPRLGRHWTLPMASLEIAAADAVREGKLAFTPPSAREEFLARAGQGGDWCVSYQVVAGQPVPAASCLDCGRLSVSVEPLDDCPRCMGELSPDLGVLDARFVGAVWPLAAAGWPARRAALDIVNTALAGTPGVIGWAVAMAALGLRLARVVPFTEVVTYSLETPHDDPDPVVPDLEELMATLGASQLRGALLKGGLP